MPVSTIARHVAEANISAGLTLSDRAQRVAASSLQRRGHNGFSPQGRTATLKDEEVLALP
jgi:hypothetical protein